MGKAWQDIRQAIGLGPLAVVVAYAAIAFGVFAFGLDDTGRAVESSVYSLLMLFVWLLLIAVFSPSLSSPSEGSDRTAHDSSLREDGAILVGDRNDGIAVALTGESEPVAEQRSKDEVRKPWRELAVLLGILVVHTVLVSWVWLGPENLRWPSWAVALSVTYALPMLFLRWGGYGSAEVGLDFRGSWKLYLFAIVAQMLLAQGLEFLLPRGLWRGDLVAGLIAIGLVLGLLGVLASPLLGERRLMLAGIGQDLGSLQPFAGLLFLLLVSQVVGSLVFIGGIGALTRPLFPLNGYFAQGPVPEEIFYRGLLQTRLQVFLAALLPKSRSVGWAILLTGLVFTAMHIPSHLATGADLGVELLDFTGGLANAFAAGYLYYRTRKLLPAIVFHSLSFL